MSWPFRDVNNFLSPKGKILIVPEKLLLGDRPSTYAPVNWLLSERLK